MTISRHERWITASFATPSFGKHFVDATVQQLGRVDVSLIEGDELFFLNFEINRNNEIENWKFNDRLTLSYLWVLGAYEVVRAVCQLMNENKGQQPKVVEEGFTNLKSKFARIRMPLAKFEPAKAHSETDGCFAIPLIYANSIGWQVSADVYITRKELSDELLGCLELARKMNPNFHA